MTTERITPECAEHIGKVMRELTRYLQLKMGAPTYHIAAIIFPVEEGHMSALPEIYTSFGQYTEGLLECGQLMCEMALASAATPPEAPNVTH